MLCSYEAVVHGSKYLDKYLKDDHVKNFVMAKQRILKLTCLDTQISLIYPPILFSLYYY